MNLQSNWLVSDLLVIRASTSGVAARVVTSTYQFSG
jgi:hypothetical protein